MLQGNETYSTAEQVNNKYVQKLFKQEIHNDTDELQMT